MQLARRTRPAVPVIVTVFSFLGSSCGDSETEPSTVGSDGTSASGRESIQYPTEADTAVVRIAGGQPRPGSIPKLVIGGDGKVYERGEVPDGLHGLPPIQPGAQPVIVRQLTPQGTQSILQRADELGLLAEPPEYEEPDVTDQGSTYVAFEAVGRTFEHSAYALTYENEIDDDRQRLSDFVKDLDDVEALVGSENVGPATQYLPERWSVSAGNTYWVPGDDPLRWPSGVEVTEGCIALNIDEFPSGVAGRYVADGAEGKQLIAVAPDMPGDNC